jgi:uncharacterized protein YutE (UPF0331/DUF86 family)
MTPGPVDLKVVADRLAIVAACVTALRNLPASRVEAFLADARNPASAESLLRRAVQALFDATRHVLSRGFGPGILEYKDAARLAQEKGLVPDRQLAERFQQIAGHRYRMTHFYDEITPEELYSIVRERLGDLEPLAHALRKAAARLARQGMMQA